MTDGVWQVCPSCGALISDSQLHDDFHAALAKLTATLVAEQDEPDAHD